MTESTVGDYFSLLKPRVMSLVVFTGLVGLLIAPGSINPFIGFISILCIAIGSGAAGAINMWYDRDIDQVMKRTKNRPIPKGIINPDNALDFGVLLSFFSVFFMAVAVGYLAAFLLLCAILFYVFIYTMWLKRSTPQNIVIGGAAGAFPPLIGWASVTGDITINSLSLFAIIFFWTPPHFWALALYSSEDYKAVGIPMLPVVSGHKVTKINIIIYTVILLIVSLLPFYTGYLGYLYLTFAVILGAIFLFNAVRLYLNYSVSLAKKTFGFSILYLFILFFIMVIDYAFI